MIDTQIVADIAKHDAFVEAQRVARDERSKEEVKATAARVKAYYERLAEVQKAADDAMKERVDLWNEIGRQRDAQVAAAQATRDAELATMRASEKVRDHPNSGAERVTLCGPEHVTVAQAPSASPSVAPSSLLHPQRLRGPRCRSRRTA
jgi:hypothetical protein